MNTVIKAEKLSKIYKIYNSPQDRLKYLLKKHSKNKHSVKEFWALRDLSFEIKQGESVGIIGCNGSGKSTLLQLIAGILKPSEGKIEVTGRIAALLELGSGFNPEFTGTENIYFNASLLGLSKHEIKEKYEDIITFADIGEFVHQPVKTYSSGMLIRLAFSVMIHVSPDILIIDEALAVGDIFFQQKCIRYLKDNFRNITKIFVAHDMSTISAICNRVIYLDKGILKFDGDIASGIENYIKSVHSHEGQSTTSLPPIQTVVNWDKLAEDKLSGALDIKITGIQVLINNCVVQPPKAYIRYQDRVDIRVLLYSTKPNIKAIFGYLVCDKFGNYVFGQNKYDNKNYYLLHEPGYYIAHYSFVWPDVHQGQYTLTPGIGEGEESLAHIIQCWAHNVLIFDCVSSHAVHGSFNNPLTYFNVEPQEENV